MPPDKSDDTEFVQFWNEVLAPKFTAYRHILQGGLSRHSAAVIPNLPIAPGMSVLDVHHLLVEYAKRELKQR